MLLATSSEQVQAQQTQASKARSPLTNRASYSFTTPDQQVQTGETNILTPELVDPLGRITGCAGEPLSDYSGFSVGVYEADASGVNLGPLVNLTGTELPDVPNNGIPAGLAPNDRNLNPYFLSGNEGTYNFLLDLGKGQLDIGRRYILVITPPAGANYSPRRVRLEITGRNGQIVSYVASSLDGRPLSSTTGASSINGELSIQNAAQTGLSLAVLDLDTSVCQAQAIQITKGGDRAAAVIGDTAIYRLSVKNLATAALDNLSVTDNLPLGFRLIPESVRAELQGNRVPVAVNPAITSGAVEFTFAGLNLPPSSSNPNAVLNIAYAVTLTPDAIRGNGENLASAAARRQDNGDRVSDGPARHRMRINSGILSDCGTIIGRVFIDRNYDGEAQPDEIGVPNAVVFLQDGNRIVTDEMGRFSVANVLPGYHTGVLDMTSIPANLTIAPNETSVERSSPSRLVRLAPGSLVKMNFAVAPKAQETGK